MTKQPLSDDDRQKFLDNLPEDKVTPDAEQKLDKAIERAAQQSRSGRGKPDLDDGYNDTQTHSNTAEDTSDSHSDTSHP